MRAFKLKTRQRKDDAHLKKADRFPRWRWKIQKKFRRNQSPVLLKGYLKKGQWKRGEKMVADATARSKKLEIETFESVPGSSAVPKATKRNDRRQQRKHQETSPPLQKAEEKARTPISG